MAISNRNKHYESALSALFDKLAKLLSPSKKVELSKDINKARASKPSKDVLKNIEEKYTR